MTRTKATATEAASRRFVDATDPDRRFFGDLPTPIDHVMVTAGRPYYARVADLDSARARREAGEHLRLMLPSPAGRATRLGRQAVCGSRAGPPRCREKLEHPWHPTSVHIPLLL
jgi:hypothetical protein